MKNLVSLLTLACIVSCQTNENPPEETAATEVEAPPAAPIDAAKPETMVGQPLEKVQAACDAAEVAHRVVEVDGEPRMATRDFRPERLNFKVKAGMVTEVTKG